MEKDEPLNVPWVLVLLPLVNDDEELILRPPAVLDTLGDDALDINVEDFDVALDEGEACELEEDFEEDLFKILLKKPPPPLLLLLLLLLPTPLPPLAAAFLVELWELGGERTGPCCRA